jgi:type VI secretion system secreted protein Hcp
VRRRLVLLLCALIAASALAIPAAATADDLFLQVPGVQGDSTDLAFVGAIGVNSFSWGVANPDNKVAHFSDFQFTKNVDRSSPRLLQLVANNQVIPTTVKLSTVKSGAQRQVYRAFCFTGVQFTNLQSSASAGGGTSSESVSFSYATVVERFTPQNEDGTLGTAILGGWDILKNLPFSGASC